MRKRGRTEQKQNLTNDIKRREKEKQIISNKKIEESGKDKERGAKNTE